MIKSMTSSISKALLLAAILGGSLAVASTQALWKFNTALGKGINLGDLLEAPYEGAWGGLTLDKNDFHCIAAKGFQSVRIPIRWDGYGDENDMTFDRMARTAPYTIDPRFFARMDSVISWSRQNHLLVVLNDHHHDSLFTNYDHEVPRFLSMWKQIAERYKNLPNDSIAFEILNEPNGQVGVDQWNTLLDTSLKVIRATNPSRPIVLGTADWGGMGTLYDLKLPEDSNLILTLHDYDPKPFVYQGASWISPAYPTGVAWGCYWDILQAINLADQMEKYSRAKDIPIFIGEFGTTLVSDSASRSKWTQVKSRLYESRGFSWSWWDYKEPEMGIYKQSEGKWSEGAIAALFSTDTSLLRLDNAPATGADLIANGIFAGTQSWSLVQMEHGTGSFTTDPKGAVITVDSNPAQISWAVEICQKALLLKGQWSYLLSLQAWSDTPTTIDTWVGHGADPWDSYGISGGMHIDSIPQTFLSSFQMPAGQNDSLGEVCINMGRNLAQIHLDSVHLYALSNPTPIKSNLNKKGSLIQMESGHLVGYGRKPLASWLVDVRGKKVFALKWEQQQGKWVADLSGAPKSRLLFVEHSAIRLVR